MSKKVALVTGGTGGLGTAMCRGLAQKGFTVVAGYYNGGEESVAAAQKWLDAFKAEGFEDVHVVAGDVGNFDDAARMVAEVKEKVGPVSVLVNNAGITRDKFFVKMTKEQWDAVINTNLNSMFNVTKHVIEDMIANKWGRIINISSINGEKGQAGQTNYSAAKAGIFGFTKALAQEVVTKGVTVNSIAPGYVATDMVMAIREDILQTIIDQVPMKRLAKPEEIGAAVCYLASEEAAFMTGANLSINGGLHM